MADHLDDVLEVVEDQEGVVEHEQGLGQGQGVLAGHGHPGLEVADHVICQVSHSAPVKPGQVGDRDQRIFVQFGFYGNQGSTAPSGWPGPVLRME